MIDAFVFLYKVLVNPKRAFRESREKKVIYPTFVYLAVFGFVSYAYFVSSFNFILPQFLNSLPDEFKQIFSSFGNVEYFRSPVLILIFICFPIFVTFISASIYDLIAQSLWKISNGTSIFVNLSFASVPNLLSRLLAITILILGKTQIPALLSLIFFVWDITLYIFAIRETYDIGTGKALLLIVIPFVMAIILLSLYLAFFTNFLSVTG
jgi:hypothetical protein